MIFNRVITSINTLLLILLSFYSVDLQASGVAGSSGQSAAIDSLSMGDDDLAELVELSRLKKDSVIKARNSMVVARSFAAPQLATFGAAASIPNLSNENLLMYLKLDHNGDDASGNGNDGQPGGNHSFVSEAHFGSSIYCIGDGYVNANGGHVSLPDLGLNNLTAFTISIWVKDEKSTPDEGLIWFGDWHTGWGGIAHLWGSTLFHVGGVGTAGGGIHMPFDSEDLGVWVMYTLVYDNGVMKVYKNGRYLDQIAVNVYIPKGQFSGLGRHWWGGNGEGNSSRYTGKIDEARVYQVALSDAEVMELYGFTDPDGGSPSRQVATSKDKNYILEYTPREEGVDEFTDLSTLDPTSRLANITYFDGLGRADQQIAIQAGPTAATDIIVPMQYDDFGREARKFLPYGSAGDGSFQDNAIDRDYSSTSDHYKFYTDPANGVVDDTKPYSQTVFEVSPLNRVLKQGAPGTTWQPEEDLSADDHSIKMAYGTNVENEVYLWMVQDDRCILDRNTYYDPGELYVNTTKDENWHSGQEFLLAGTIKEYKDKQGRVILKRSYNDENDAYDTYYVYDDFNNLRFVIPPEAVRQLSDESWAEISDKEVFTSDAVLEDDSPGEYYYGPGVTVSLSEGTFGSSFEVKPYPLGKVLQDDYLFAYKYDDRRRMVEKKVPGAELVYMVYDSRDRLALSQDGVQRQSGSWFFTKYDVLNRPVLTGLTNIEGSRTFVQDMVNEFYDSDPADKDRYYEERQGTSDTDDLGYTDRSFPVDINNADYLTSTYYDDYEFIANHKLEYYNEPDGPYDQNVLLGVPRGQATGGKVKNLQDRSWLASAVYYDRKYRVIYSVAQNHLGGWDKTLSYYSFTGELTNQYYLHSAHDQEELILDKTFNYDHMSRLLSVDVKINETTTPVTLLTNKYNEIGELVTKYLHGNEIDHAQQVDYNYNIRGWLTDINDPANVSLEGDYFGMKLKYDETPTASLGGMAQFNGNISEIQWQNAQTTNLSGYGFVYDKINRLRNAHYGDGAAFLENNGAWDENLTYDFNGNISVLDRYADGQHVDELDYDYSGNQLNYVHDGISDYMGEENHFKDGNPGDATDYEYDDNGNMTRDANKGITSISYNHLNLPALITFDNNPDKSIAYIYDATGVKLKKVVKEPGKPDKETNYINGIVYEDDVRSFVQTEEGRIMLETGDPEYQYHMKDHLGNVRLTFTTASEEERTSTYMATMEAEVAELEEGTFDHISSTRFPDAIFNHTPGGLSSARLNAWQGTTMGPAMSLHVMAGDKVDMSVFAKYTQQATSTDPVTGMATMIAASAGAGAIAEVSQISQGLQEVLGLGQVSLFSPDNSRPKAYLNYLFFNMKKVFRKGGFIQVSQTALNAFEELNLTFEPEEEGYVLIYMANQTDEDLNVFFDDLTINHIEGPIIRTDDYYPFGLTFNSSERSGYTTNKFLYNGFELQTDLSLGLYDYQARYYDPAIGRFLNIDPAADLMRRYSPYNYAFDNPIRFIDPDGMFPDGINSGIFMRAALDPDVQKYSTQVSNSASNILKGSVKIGKKVGTGLDVNTQLGPVKFKANVSAASASLETEVNNSGDVTYKGEVNVGDAEVELSVGDSKLTGEAKGIQLTAEYSAGEGIKGDVKAAKLEGKFSEGTTGFELKKDDAKIGGKVKVGKVVEVGGSIHLGELYDTVVNSFKAISAYGDALLNEVSRSTETQQEQQTENSFFNW